MICRLPVPAVTANALDGDRERCLATGMDDYLAKPFRMEELVAMVRRHSPRSHTVAAS
jgi:CheY-like chemotaxis protein